VCINIKTSADGSCGTYINVACDSENISECIFKNDLAIRSEDGTENSSRLGCYVVSTGKQLSTFRTRALCLKSKTFQEISGCLETLLFSEIPVTNSSVDMALTSQVTYIWETK
jgi:hypothetical protein